MRVADEDYLGRYLVLASGSFPRTLPGVEVDGHLVINSDHALKLGQLPSSAIRPRRRCHRRRIRRWRSLGVEVTLVEAMPHLVPTECRHRRWSGASIPSPQDRHPHRGRGRQLPGKQRRHHVRDLPMAVN